MSHGADVNFVNKKNQTSLLLACEKEKWDVAIALYQHIMATEVGKSTEQRRNIDKEFQIVMMQHHVVGYLQHVAKNDHCVYDSLVSNVSLSDACKYGYDLVVKHHLHHQEYSQNYIVDAVKIAHSEYNSDVVHVLVPSLTNRSLSELITHSYQQADYRFAHKLLEACTDQSSLPCPGISITDACKARQVDVVEFLIKQHGKDVNNAADELGYRLKYLPDDADTLLHVLKASVEDNQTDDAYSPAKVEHIPQCNERSQLPSSTGICLYAR